MTELAQDAAQASDVDDSDREVEVANEERLTERPWVRRTGFAALAVALAVVTWPDVATQASIGLDNSYLGALAMAQKLGLDFGSDLVFTYGPLGFLTANDFYSAETSVLAFVAVGAVHLAAAVTYLWLFWNRLRWWGAAAVALVLLSLGSHAFLSFSTIAGGLVTTWCLALVLRSRSLRSGQWWLLVAAVPTLTAVLLLHKFNFGFFAVLVGLVAVPVATVVRWTGDDAGWRELLRTGASAAAAFAGALVVLVLGLWLITGQALTALPDYLRYSWELSEAFAANNSAIDGIAGGLATWDWPLVVLLVVGAGTVVGLSTVAMEPLRRPLRLLATLALGITTFIALFALFKQGFVRHQGEEFYRGVALLVAAPLASLRVRVAVPAAVAISVLVFAGLRWPAEELTGAPETVESLARTSALLAYPPGWEEERQSQQSDLRAEYGIPETMIDRIGGSSVQVLPWETNAVWAYQLNWKPVPVFHTYHAYTEGLDDLNAEALVADGSDFILWQELGEQYKQPTWQSPRLMLEVVCNYTVVERSTAWQLLQRLPDSRCGEPEVIASVDTGSGNVVEVGEVLEDVPEHDLVVATFSGFDPGTLRSALYEGERFYVRWGDEEVDFRFVPGTSGQPHLFWVPDEWDLVAGHSLEPVDRIAFLSGSVDPATAEEHERGAVPLDDVTVTFLRVPYE